MTAAIVEDQEMFLDFLHKICEDRLHFSVVGAVRTGGKGIELCKRYRPDLLLLDLDLPDGNGLDMVPYFKTASPHSKILAVSVLVDEYTMNRVVESGVDGFIDKEGSSVEKLVTAISAVMKGGAYFAPVVVHVRQRIFGDPSSWHKFMTAHEVDVLRLIGSGLSNEEAAAKLGLSPATIETHRREIMAKLKLHSVRELIRFAVHHGLAKL